jgi:type I restriction enzyme S subunit
MSQNTAQPFLNMSDIKNYIFPFPPLNEQRRIVSKIDQLMKLCDELEQSIHYNLKYTQELLQVALKEALEPEVI